MAATLGATLKRIGYTAGAALAALALLTSCGAGPSPDGAAPPGTPTGSTSANVSDPHGKYGSKLRSVLSRAEDQGFDKIIDVSLGLKNDITTADFRQGEDVRSEHDLEDGNWEIELDVQSSKTHTGPTMSPGLIEALATKIDGLALDVLAYAKQRNMLVDSRVLIRPSFRAVPGSEFATDTPVVEFNLYDPTEKVSKTGLRPLNYRVYSAETYELLWQFSDTSVVGECFWLGEKGDAACLKSRDTFAGS